MRRLAVVAGLIFAALAGVFLSLGVAAGVSWFGMVFAIGTAIAVCESVAAFLYARGRL